MTSTYEGEKNPIKTILCCIESQAKKECGIEIRHVGGDLSNLHCLGFQRREKKREKKEPALAGWAEVQAEGRNVG